MKIVLDTNVLVSGIYFRGTPSRILEAWGDGRFDLLASVDVLTEYQRVVHRLAKQFPDVDARPVLNLVVRGCRVVAPVSVPESACTDPDDLKFIACALAGRATCVVSGDRALLRSSGFRGISVCRPTDFARRCL